MANQDVESAEPSTPAAALVAGTASPERGKEPPTTRLSKGQKKALRKKNRKLAKAAEQGSQNHGLAEDSFGASFASSPTAQNTPAPKPTPQPQASDQFSSPARSTRSKKPALHNNIDWEALDIEQNKTSPLNIMSRNRQRGAAGGRDNGAAANEEIEMWNRIFQDIHKAKEKNEKQRALGQQIAALNEKIAKDGNSESFHFGLLFSGA